MSKTIIKKKRQSSVASPRSFAVWAIVVAVVCCVGIFWASRKTSGQAQNNSAIAVIPALTGNTQPINVADASNGNQDWASATQSMPPFSEQESQLSAVKKERISKANDTTAEVSNSNYAETAEKAAESVAIFDNPVETQLENVSRKGFESLVTLRVNLPQEEILAILNRPVDIYDDDDEETVLAKERTAEMKREALEYIAAGGTFNQFLRDCQFEAKEARETVMDVREEMKRILYSQGEEAAQEYLDKQNPILRELGLPEVHIGKGLLRKRKKEN